MRITANHHDFIKFFVSLTLSHFDEFRHLYEKGCSLREISTLTGYPKSTIRKEFVRNSYPLRAGTKATEHELKIKIRCNSGLPPYGFSRLDGKLVIDPKEAKVLRKILEMHKKGMSFCAITDALNQQKIPSKTGKKWNRQITASVIKRHQ